MSHPVGINSSSDRPRSYCATMWRPASSMTGSACCHMSSTGAQTSSRRSRYDRSEFGRLPEPAEAIEEYLPVLRGSPTAWPGRAARWPPHASMADHSSSGSVAPTAPASWARTCISVKQISSAAVVPEGADAICEVFAALEHLGQLADTGPAWRVGRPRTAARTDRSPGTARRSPTLVLGGPLTSSVNIGIRLY